MPGTSSENRFLSRLRSNIAELADRRFATLVGFAGEQSLTWAEFGRDCAAFAAAYRALGLEPGSTILIFLSHDRALYGSFFGAMMAGCVPSFMPTRTPKQDKDIYWKSHRTLVATIRPRALVASPQTVAEMTEAGIDLAGIAIVSPDPPEAGAAEWSERPSDAICLLQHSSGTTGLKKGVALSFDAIVGQLESYASALELSKHDVIASWLPLYHDMGLIACCLLPAYHGLPVTQIDAFYWLAKPDSLFLAIMKDRGTLAWMPNFAFDHLSNLLAARAGRYDLSGVKALISCSETCRASTFDRFAKIFAPAGLTDSQLQCCYAMAETVFAVTQTRIGQPVRRFGGSGDASGAADPSLPSAGDILSSGRVVDGLNVAIRPIDAAADSPRLLGEIVISGDFLFSGYNLDPDRTREKIKDGVYHTNDLGFFDEGELYVIGRNDDMMIVNGRNLFAHEIESLLNAIDGLKPGRNIVWSQFDERAGSDVIIVVAERSPASPRIDGEIVTDILNLLQSSISVQPKTVKIVPDGWLVKTTSGKISRKATQEKLKSREL